LATVDWHSDRASVGMAHDVVATVDPRDSEASALERLDDLRSRPGWYPAQGRKLSEIRQR
jgi:hypothetical protein